MMSSNPHKSTDAPSKQSKKRSVRFASGHSVVCLLETREELQADKMIEELYFSRAEYQMSRSGAKVISKEAERYGYSKNLDETYSSKSAEIQDRLNLWACHGHSRRGLERWANTKHGEERQQDQFQAIMAVLRAQDEMISKKNEVDCEKLRKVSHKATKTSRHFARMMGKADSYAMAQELRQEQGLEASSIHPEIGEAERIAPTPTEDDATAISRDISLPGGDLKDSQHTMAQRFKRFGLGRKKAVEERVPRVA